MRHCWIGILLFAVGFGPIARSAQAQEKDAGKKVQTADRASVTYVGGNNPLTPSSILSVRKRIDALRGRPGTTIQPIIILLPGGSGADSISSALGSSSFAGAVRPAEPEITQADLDRLEARLMRRMDERMDELYRRLEQRIEVRQDSRVEPRAQTPLQDTLVVSRDVPSVEVVEVALLETGLFRTTAILFEFDSDRLLESSEATLRIIGDVLDRHSEIVVEVLGHTDSVGTETYNQSLSDRRAASVRAFLTESLTIAPERIVAIGLGERDPIATNGTDTGRALNRRVEFRVVESGDSAN